MPDEERNAFGTWTGRLPTSPHCHSCGTLIDGWTGANKDNPDAKPDPGDVSICAYCGAPGIFTNDQSLRAPTKEELAEIMSDPRLRRMLRDIQAIHFEHWGN